MRPTPAYRAAIARLHATDAQLTYLRRLLPEAHAHGYRHVLCIDVNHLEPRIGKKYASQAISELLAAKARGWKTNVAR